MQVDASAPPGVAAPPIRLALAWGILSLVGFGATWVVIGSLMAQFERASGMSHAFMLGLWALAWVPVAGLLTLAAARIVFGAWPAVATSAWLVLLVGALVGAAHVWVLADWAIARYGYSDPDFIGPTFGLFAVVAGVAVAGFGIQMVSRAAAWMPLLAVAGGVALAISIISSNIPGLANGLGGDSGPLAVATVAATLYVGAVAALSVARLRRG